MCARTRRKNKCKVHVFVLFLIFLGAVVLHASFCVVLAASPRALPSAARALAKVNADGRDVPLDPFPSSFDLYNSRLEGIFVEQDTVVQQILRSHQVVTWILGDESRDKSPPRWLLLCLSLTTAFKFMVERRV